MCFKQSYYKYRVYNEAVYKNSFFFEPSYLCKDKIYMKDSKYYWDIKLKDYIPYNWYHDKASLFNLEQALNIVANLYISLQHVEDGQEKYYFGIEKV